MPRLCAAQLPASAVVHVWQPERPGKRDVLQAEPAVSGDFALRSPVCCGLCHYAKTGKREP